MGKYIVILLLLTGCITRVERTFIIREVVTKEKQQINFNVVPDTKKLPKPDALKMKEAKH